MIKKTQTLSPITYHISHTFGFTLIELLVVISIIGILAGLTLSSYSGAQKQARDTQRKSDLTQLKTSLEAYYSANNAYPSTGGSDRWRGACPGSLGGGYERSGLNGYIPNLAPTFVEELPIDPRNDQTYNCGGGWTSCYLYTSNGTDYKLLAHCSPETGYPTNSPFYDDTRKTWAWQVHSSDVSKMW